MSVSQQRWREDKQMFCVLQGPGLTDEQVLQLCRGVVTAQISQYASSIRAKCSQGCPINNRTLIGPPGGQGPPGPAGKPVNISPTLFYTLFTLLPVSYSIYPTACFLFQFILYLPYLLIPTLVYTVFYTLFTLLCLIPTQGRAHDYRGAGAHFFPRIFTQYGN